ncbi:MAG TPA: hypothetical protein VEQ63_06515, partial [Bryobacteraceae bacterium]|nr:hypothetical protein [Bryobacteraceae bacterium]
LGAAAVWRSSNTRDAAAVHIGPVYRVALGMLRSRGLEQEVPDLSHEPTPPPRAVVLYVPITTQRRDSHYEVALWKLASLDKSSVANVQGLATHPA